MPYLKKSNALFNPYSAWNDLAVTTSEMMLASAHVIRHRTGRMAISGSLPSIRDQQEFTLMGQEKIEAMTESTQAMALQMMTVNPLLGLRAFELMMEGSTAMLSLATSENMAQTLKRQAELARVMTESANATSQLSDTAVKIARHGLTPIHSRVTANARRLAKRSP